jgi:hypothetical protein
MVMTVFAARPIPLPHRNAPEHAQHIEQTWSRQRAGALHLPVGSTTLVIEAVSILGCEVMSLKGIVLRLTEAQGDS